MDASRPRQPLNWRQNLLFASLGVFIAAVGFSLSTPFLPMFLGELGVKANLSFWTGLVMASAALAYGVMAPVWGSLADRHGKRVMLVRSGAGIAVTYFLMGLAQDQYQLLGLRVVNGFLGGFVPAAIVLIASNTPAPHLGFALGVVQTSAAVGNIMGPLLGGVSAKLLGVRACFFLVSGLIALAMMLAVLGTREDDTRAKERQSVLAGVREVLSYPTLRLLLLAQVLVQAALFAIQPTLPLYVASLTSADVEVITGAVFAVVGVSTAIGAPILGRFAGHASTRLYCYGLTFAAGLCLLQGFTRSVAWLGAERFLMGFANAAISVSSNVLIAQSVTAERRGRAFGVLNSFYSLGFVAGPLLGGFLGDNFGLATPFFGCTVMYLAALLLFRSRPSRRDAGQGSAG